MAPSAKTMGVVVNLRSAGVKYQNENVAAERIR
jgi:hypothetical protein